MTSKTRTSADQSLLDCERIRDPARVARLLEQLARRHALLTVDIPGHAEQYTSCIVGVEGSCVLLDELMPAAGHPLLLTERRLQTTGKLDGIDIRFTTALDHVQERDGVVTYHARLPGVLEYRQRRLDFRAPVPMAQRLRVILEGRDGTLTEGLLHDLSHGGAGILFPGGTPAVVLGLSCECAIELPDAVWLYCTVELCHMSNCRYPDRQLVGARFGMLSAAQVRLIGQCINALERELIRKRAVAP